MKYKTVKSPLGKVRVYLSPLQGSIEFCTMAFSGDDVKLPAIPLTIKRKKVGLLHRLYRITPHAAFFAPMPKAGPLFWVFDSYPQKAAVPQALRLKFMRWAQKYANNGIARRMDVENLLRYTAEYDRAVVSAAHENERRMENLREMRRHMRRERRRLGLK